MIIVAVVLHLKLNYGKPIFAPNELMISGCPFNPLPPFLPPQNHVKVHTVPPMLTGPLAIQGLFLLGLARPLMVGPYVDTFELS